MLKFVKKKLRASVDFERDIAKGLMKTKYYEALSKDMKEEEFRDSEKIRLATPKWEKITEILEFYKELGETTETSTAKVLNGIYQRNVDAAIKGTKPSHDKLLSIVAKPEMLLLSYREIRGNKGALTCGDAVSKEKFNEMDESQKEIYLKSFTLPDGMSLHNILLISQLLQKGKYPWGTSSRVYVEKPGQKGKLRPITIPPFTDRIVQKAIELVLHSIYEPHFERRNRSFGFRPNRGTHDALTALLSYYTNGMRTAVEGDVEAAYDTVDKKVLLEILSRRICDRKFLKLVEERLDYDYVEKETGLRVRPVLGIPQGGIDSPYLFNIYMMELDDYVHEVLQKEVDEMNSVSGATRTFSKLYTSNRARKKKELRALNSIKRRLSTLPQEQTDPLIRETRMDLFKAVKQVRRTEYKKNGMSSASSQKRVIRIFYVRYADDWILLTNGDRELAQIFKDKISTFLSERLKLRLSPHKTLITDITKAPARFLGFEIRASARGALRRLPVTKAPSHKKYTLAKKSGLILWAAPDRNRLINRFFMRGLCNRNGFPKEIPWLSSLEAFTIIQRFNASIRGSAEFLLPIVRDRATIIRWIYILRYSCLKTLAQKYKCSIAKIFKRFGHNLHSRAAQTVRVRVVQSYRGEKFYKDFTLLTYNDLVNLIQYKERRKAMLDTFLERENGVIGEYPLKKGRIAKVTNDDYVKSLSWVNWRTAAAMDMPCAYCMSSDNVEMHHLKHIRKRAYKTIPQDLSYKQVLALRNRKQIPLCRECHKKYVHTGKYDGPALVKLAPTVKLGDNRVVHVESFVKPGVQYGGKSLLEKGWSTY